MNRTVNYQRRSRVRQGFGTLLFMLLLVIFIALLMLVLNYTYLAYSQLRTADVTDTLARTAVAALLDEDLLDAPPMLDQTNDIAAVQVEIAALNTALNNAAGANQQLRYVPGNNAADTDIFVHYGWVEDVSQPVTEGLLDPTFLTTPPANTPFNTLRIEASRPKNGANPLYMFVRGLITPTNAAADIGTISYATLDSRLVGFQPTPTVNIPVVPIGILDSGWNSRTNNVGGSARLDFEGQLREHGSAVADGNLVLLNFDEDAMGVDPDQIANQIRYGSSSTDIHINGGDFLGPIIPGSVSLTLAADDETPIAGQAQAIANALNDVATGTVTNDRRRIFPLYSTYSSANGEAVLVGFVAGTILPAPATQYDAGDQRLKIAIEPEFVIHFTAVTSRNYDDGMVIHPVPENVYIHKLRLSR
jgi:hypothetical protein